MRMNILHTSGSKTIQCANKVFWPLLHRWTFILFVCTVQLLTDPNRSWMCIPFLVLLTLNSNHFVLVVCRAMPTRPCRTPTCPATIAPPSDSRTPWTRRHGLPVEIPQCLTWPLTDSSATGSTTSSRTLCLASLGHWAATRSWGSTASTSSPAASTSRPGAAAALRDSPLRAQATAAATPMLPAR